MATEVIAGDGWTLAPIGEPERPLADHLLQFNSYDFSEIDHDDVDETGCFGTREYGRYGRDPGHDAWLFRVAGKPAGFALIGLASTHPGNSSRHDVREFHVLGAYRRHDLEAAIAIALFDRYRGAWLIEQIGPNLEAQLFWRRAIDRYAGGWYVEYTEQACRFPLIFQEFDTADRVPGL